jgi:NAD-dependent SIR2 family protein deacetylase
LAAKWAPFLKYNNPKFWHGRLYSGPRHRPSVTWECNEPPRDDHDCPNWLTASEFEDHSDALRAKCEQLAELMRLSKRTVIYTGAGISASVVGQAARTGANEQGWKAGGGRYAKPTETHFLLSNLARAGFIHEWIQQNHDGLPQKAGFPQEKINEVHGSWYDPSNPVVKYGGTLRDEERWWMKHAARTADLVIVLGTSLGGLNADQVATKASNRSLDGNALGTVCINLQQTPEDGRMSLRIFGTSDKVLTEVCKNLREDLAINLGLQEGQELSLTPPSWTSDVRALVPYNANGHRVEEGEPWMWLDLSTGKEVHITEENNLKGSMQPSCKHLVMEPGELMYGVERMDIVFSPGIPAMNVKRSGRVAAVREGLAKRSGVQRDWIVRKIIVNGVEKLFTPELLREVVLEGTADYTLAFDVPRTRPATPLAGTVSRRDDAACCFDLEIGGKTFHFGIWWLEAAARGALKTLPIMNTSPEFCAAPSN